MTATRRHPPEVLAAVPSLFGEDGALDVTATRRMHERLTCRLDGVFVAGTTGEFPALSDEERIRLFELALDAWGPERVVAHVGSPATAQAVGLAARAVALGVRRIAALPPYYFAVDASDIETHWRAVRAVAGPSELYAYLFPERTSVHVKPALLQALVEAGVINGAKVSGSAAADVDQYLAALPPHIPVWSGADVRLPEVYRSGGRGVVSGLSAALPEPFATVRDALAAHDTAATASGRGALQEIADTAIGSAAGIKCALSALGIGTPICRMLQGAAAQPDADEVGRLISQHDTTARAHK